MKVETTSQHLRNAHELFLLVPLKREFIENTDRLTSPASRLRALLALINGPTQSAVEKTLMPTASSVQILQNLYSFHYGVVDSLQAPQLILSAVYDSSWETYFHNLVDKVGPFLDAIFCHCQGFEGRTCFDGYEAFSEFVREHQVQSGFFYESAPDLTTDDIRILRPAATGKPLGQPLRRLVDEVEDAKPAWVKEMKSAQGADYPRLRERDLGRFIGAVWEVRKLFPDKAEAPGGRNAQTIFDEAAQVIAASYFRDAENAPLVEGYLRTNGAHGSFPPEQEARAWLRDLTDMKRATGAQTAVPELGPDDLKNIQGNILEAYPRAEEGVLVLMQLPPNDGGKLLGALANELTSAYDSAPSDPQQTPALPRTRINVALTYAGLRRAGLDQGALELFPKEFREGMQQRAGSLGDVGWPNHPDYWQPLPRNYRCDDGSTFSLDSVDLVLTLQRGAPNGNAAESSQDSLDDELQRLLKKIGGERCVLGTQPLCRGRDHFGFPELEAAESQPAPRVVLGKRQLHPERGPNAAGYDNTVALGELLLGYHDDRGQVARCADPRLNTTSAKLFVDGTFMVIRKLRQYSKRFHEQLGAARKDTLQSILGRDEQGRSLVCPAKSAASSGAGSGINALNDFDYEEDKLGARCPLYAHVRRANPRTKPFTDPGRTRDPRIMRRSFQYGPEFKLDHAETHDLERGHMFIAYNASIAEQYEVIQRWVSGGNSTGLLSTRRDPLAGGLLPPECTRPDGAEPSGVAEAASGPVVSLAWGLYLFVPSRAALAFLSDLDPRRARTSRHEQARLRELGARRIRELDAIGDPELARLAWKQLIEEPSYIDDATAVWRVIRESGGTKKTPYGTLVADLETVRKVLSDDGSKFSVRDYWHRLTATMGEFYLGLDRVAGQQDRAVPEPLREDSRYEARLRATSYERLAATPNRLLPESVAKAPPYETARHYSADFVAAHGERFDLRDLAKVVVGKLSADWIGIPSAVSSDEQLKDFLQNFIMVSRYCFFPHPAPWLEAEAKERGKAMRQAYDRDSLAQGELARLLKEANYASPSELRSAVIGANIGFVPPTVAIIVGVLNQWIVSGQLAQLGRELVGMREPDAIKLLYAPLLAFMKESPTFPIIYRRALQDNGLVEPGELVVVSLQSAYTEAEEQGEQVPASWLFGGEHGGAISPERPTHGCPMRDPALQTILGVIAAVAEVARKAPLVRDGFVTFSTKSYRA